MPLPGIVALAGYGVAVVCTYKVIGWAFGDSPSHRRTVTHSKTWYGAKKKVVKYHDTGKVIEHRHGRNLLGDKVVRTYVTNPGVGTSDHRSPEVSSGSYHSRRRLVTTYYQLCRGCGANVPGTRGSYVCGCGRKWGRR